MKSKLLFAAVCMLVIGSCKGNPGSKEQSLAVNALDSKAYASDAQRATFRTDCSKTAEGAATPCAILDSLGREILLRGVNARIEGLFDVSFQDGRAPLETISAFDQSDTEDMRRIGFYFLRLPINWSGIEPSMGQYSTAYLEKIGRILDICHKAGIRVLLDMHQDAFSKEIGEDGAPLWAITPEPELLNPGGSLDLYPLRTAKQTQKAFISFWNNEAVGGKGLQEHFIASASLVLQRFKDHPALVGMEVFNEPWLLYANAIMGQIEPPGPQLDLNLLYDFYKKAIPRLQETAPRKLVFFEPDVSKNYPPVAAELLYKATPPASLPWNAARTVYSPHLYIAAFFSPGDAATGYANINPQDPHLDLSLQNSIEEAKAFQAPLLIGEFGFTDKATQYRAVMNKVLQIADQHAMHTAQWLWKENSQDAWGFFDFTDGKPTLREATARATARAYPLAISGRIHTIDFNPETYELNVSFRYRNTGAAHLLFLPISYGYAQNFEVSCNGKHVAATKVDAFGKVAVRCGRKEGQVNVLRVTAVAK